MTIDRIKLCAIAAAVATTLTGEVYGQTGSTGAGGSSPSMSAPAPAGARALSNTPATGQAGVAAPAAAGTPSLTNSPSASPAQSPPRARTDPTAVQSTPPAATQPSASKGLDAGTGGAAATTTPGGVTGGVPAISGVTPNRAELASSAFTKLDAGNRGYVTPEDVRQLDGFNSAFRQADQNGDGRLNASEFNAAWSAYTGNAR